MKGCCLRGGGGGGGCQWVVVMIGWCEGGWVEGGGTGKQVNSQCLKCETTEQHATIKTKYSEDCQNVTLLFSEWEHEMEAQDCGVL